MGFLKSLRFWLFIATFLSLSFSWSAFVVHTFSFDNPYTIFDGVGYAAALMFILLSHEMGHFIVARYWGLEEVKGPIFIPMPFSPIGTLGAIIVLKEKIPNKKAVFDVGTSGPWAGLAAILLLTLFDYGPQASVQLRYAIFWGLVITAINLMPAGSLDGGHILYAWCNKNFIKISIVLLISIMLVLFLLRSTIINPTNAGMLVFLAGLRHPPTQNDAISLDSKRKFLAVMNFIIFIALLFGMDRFVFLLPPSS